MNARVRAVLDLSAGWAAALLTLAGIVLLAVGIATHGLTAATIAVTVVGLIFVGWLLWLSFIVAGHGERIDDAADLADRALGATGEVYDADAGTRGRHAAKPAQMPQDALEGHGDTLDGVTTPLAGAGGDHGHVLGRATRGEVV